MTDISTPDAILRSLDRHTGRAAGEAGTFEGEPMPKVVACLISGWESRALALHHKRLTTAGAATEPKPSPESTDPLAAVLARHGDTLDGLRGTRFARTVLPAAEKDAVVAMRRLPATKELNESWTLDDDAADSLLTQLTAALDRRLSLLAAGTDHRRRIRDALHAEAARIKAALVDDPDGLALVDDQVRRIIGRIDSRLGSTPRSNDEIDELALELTQTLGFVTFLAVLVGTPSGRELVDEWRSAAADDTAATGAWKAFDDTAAVPPSGWDDPGLDTTSIGPHTQRNALLLAEGVLSPKGARRQSPLPPRLADLATTVGTQVTTNVILLEEVGREAFPFALSQPDLRRDAALAWLLLEARHNPTHLVERVTAVKSDPATADLPVTGLLAEVVRTLAAAAAGRERAVGVGIWDLAVIADAIQRDAEAELSPDGWNDTLADAVFGIRPMSVFLRRSLGPDDLRVPPQSDRQPVTSDLLVPAGHRLQRHLTRLNASGGLRSLEPDDLHSHVADEVFGWLLGNLRGTERAAGPGVSPPETAAGSRRPSAEINRWMTSSVLAGKAVDVLKLERLMVPASSLSSTDEEDGDYDFFASLEADPTAETGSSGGISLVGGIETRELESPFAISPRPMTDGDFVRIQQTFAEPVEFWIGQLEAKGVAVGSGRLRDLGETRSWVDLSIDTLVSMDVLARWSQRNPGADPPTSPLPGGRGDKAIAIRPNDARRALDHLSQVLAWRAASELTDPDAVHRWTKPGDADTFRRSAEDYYRFADFGKTNRTYYRWSDSLEKLGYVLWTYVNPEDQAT